MAVTTFTGPVKAGSIATTTGTTVGTDMANVGYVVMAQSETVTQVATTDTTNIIIPANSQVISITLNSTVVWDATESVQIGQVGDADYFTEAEDPAAAVGLHFFGSAIDNALTAAQAAVWADVGTSDVRVIVTSNATGSGTGTLTVQYLQAMDFS